ncbi:MAG: hypothetical protein WCW65_02660 [Candidatus Paceibacterota bacterium]
MTYKQAEKLAYKSRWKIKVCGSGNECWCRGIYPEKEILFKQKNLEGEMVEELYFVEGVANMSKKLAIHVVKLHNNSLRNKRKS